MGSNIDFLSFIFAIYILNKFFFDRGSKDIMGAMFKNLSSIKAPMQVLVQPRL